MSKIVAYIRARSGEHCTSIGLAILLVLGVMVIADHYPGEANALVRETSEGITGLVSMVMIWTKDTIIARVRDSVLFLRRTPAAAQPAALSMPKPLFLKDTTMTFFDTLLADFQAEKGRLIAEAEAAADAFLEAHFSTSLTTLSGEAQEFAADAKAAHDTGTKQAWAGFVAKYAEKIDAAAKAAETPAAPTGATAPEQTAS